MSKEPHATRRDFLRKSLAATGAISAPWIVPARALGRDGAVAPSEKITLGVIGIGPRCTYDLKAMLGLPDVQCVAIADVQASRRDAGKKLVDEHYGNQDCVLYRDFRELLERKDIDAVLIATGDRWHAPASIMAAKAGKDVYSEKPCGLTIAYCQELADTMQRTGRVFQAGTQRRSVPNFQQAVQLAHSGKLGKIHTLLRLGLHAGNQDHLVARRADAAAGGRRLESLAGAGALAAVQQPIRRRRMARILRLRFRRKTTGLGSAHGRPLPVGQPSRRHDAHRVRAVGEECHRALRQRSQVGAGFPGNAVWRTIRDGFNTWAPVRFVLWETKVGWKSVTAARSKSIRPHSKGELQQLPEKTSRGLDVIGPFAQLLRLYQVARSYGGQPDR